MRNNVVKLYRVQVLVDNFVIYIVYVTDMIFATYKKNY